MILDTKCLLPDREVKSDIVTALVLQPEFLYNADEYRDEYGCFQLSYDETYIGFVREALSLATRKSVNLFILPEFSVPRQSDIYYLLLDWTKSNIDRIVIAGSNYNYDDSTKMHYNVALVIHNGEHYIIEKQELSPLEKDARSINHLADKRRNKTNVFFTPIGRLCLMICNDLTDLEYLAAIKAVSPDILCVVAWQSDPIEHWNPIQHFVNSCPDGVFVFYNNTVHHNQSGKRKGGDSALFAVEYPNDKAPVDSAFSNLSFCMGNRAGCLITSVNIHYKRPTLHNSLSNRQSVPFKQDYLFENGVIRETLPKDYQSRTILIRIDNNFIHSHTVDPERHIDIIREYYSISKDFTAIASVVCSGLHATNDEYDSLISDILTQALKDKSATFLLADSGSGKSTLLLAMAVTAAQKPDVEVLYLDFKHIVWTDKLSGAICEELRRAVERHINKEIILCIDNPYTKQDEFHEICNELMDPKKLDFYSKLHIIITEQPVWAVDLLESDTHPIRMQNAKIRYIPDLLKEGHNLPSYFDDNPVLLSGIPTEIKKMALTKIIEVACQKWNLSTELIKETLDLQSSSNQSFVNLWQDSKLSYNELVDKENATIYANSSPIPKIISDWEMWENAFVDPIQVVSDDPLQNVFKYICALNLFNIDMTFCCLARLTDTSPLQIKERILKHFPIGSFEPVRTQEYGLSLRHDSVAIHYFEEFISTVSPEECLLYLINQNVLDDDTVVSFERKVFSLRRIIEGLTMPFEINLRKLIQAFDENMRYINILVKKNRIHSFESARIITEAYLKHPNNVYAQRSFIQNELAASFLSIISLDISDKLKINIWNKYFSLSIKFCDTLPPPLFDFVNTDTYKSVTARLKTMHNSMRRILKDEEKLRFDEFSISIYRNIITIVPNDIAAGVDLAKTYLDSGEYEQARILYKEIEDIHPDDEKYQVNMINTFLREIRDLKNTTPFFHSDYSEKAITLKKEIIIRFENLIKKYPTDMNIFSYSRYLKDIGDFQNVITMLQKLPDESVRKHIELGMLYSSNSIKYESIYDLSKSVKHFLYALNGYDKAQNQNKHLLMSILMPLANACFTLGKYEEVITNCQKVIDLDRYQVQAHELKKKAFDALEKMSMQADAGQGFSGYVPTRDFKKMIRERKDQERKHRK